MLTSALKRHAKKLLLMSALSVRQHARYDARQTPPQPCEDTCSPTETKLRERLEHQVATLVHARDHALRTERVNAIANDLAADERSFDDLVRDTKNEIWVARLKFNATWTEARQFIARRREDLAQFKQEHLLKRDAVYHSLVLAVGVLLLACVAETAVNAALFAQVSSWGYAGGALNSLALSLPNLGLGFIAGFWGLRGRSHIQPAVRWAATIALILAITGVAIWNFYVGHLRILAELRAESRRPLLLSQLRDVTNQISTDPAAVLASPQAVLLIAFGIVIFIIALYDGLDGFADRYPGFAKVDRRLRSALTAALTLKWQFFAQLTKLTEAGINRIDARASLIDHKCQEGLRILDRARTIIGRYNHRAAEELWIYRAAIREYQSLNRRLRDDHTVPPRFDEPIAPDVVLPVYDWHGMREKIRAAARAATDAADDAAITLIDHRLSTIDAIDREGLEPNQTPSLLPPPLTRQTKEAA